MMNSNQKEGKILKVIEDYFTSIGAVFQRSKRKMIRVPGRWISRGNDFFNRFDLMAIERNKHGTKSTIAYIQSTTEDNRHARFEKITKDGFDIYMNGFEAEEPIVTFEVWAYVEGRGKDKHFRIFHYYQNDWLEMETLFPLEVEHLQHRSPKEGKHGN